MGFTRGIQLALSCIALLGGAFACSLNPNGFRGPVVKTCVLPDEQNGTISGHWRTTPIPIAFHANDFSQEEMREIAKAVATWNSFYAESLGYATLDIGSEGAGFRTSPNPRPASLCSQGILQGGQFSGPVVIYKLGTWPYSSAQAIALTSFCPSPATPFPSFYMAVMELNYQNFFVAGTKKPDIQSIVLHELGHVIGLNHSCEMSAAAGVPGCKNAGSSAYSQAVMAPVFSFDLEGYGEQKRTLTANDQGRANCLYQKVDSGG